MNENNYVGMGHNPNPHVPDIPEGFSMALMQNSDARSYFLNLSDSQKTNVIKYVQSNNRTGEDAKYKINHAIQSLSQNTIDFM